MVNDVCQKPRKFHVPTARVLKEENWISKKPYLTEQDDYKWLSGYNPKSATRILIFRVIEPEELNDFILLKDPKIFYSPEWYTVRLTMTWNWFNIRRWSKPVMAGSAIIWPFASSVRSRVKVRAVRVKIWTLRVWQAWERAGYGDLGWRGKTWD